MRRRADQILTVAQMRSAESALIEGGTCVNELMQRAGCGAAEYVWRMAAHRMVTVLCGPGNNGGDGYVIAEVLRERGSKVAVVAVAEPKTEAAMVARGLYQGVVLGLDVEPHGEVLVDCLFGSGLSRALTAEHAEMLARLAASHRHRIAIDVPSGVDGDSGAMLNEGLPQFDLTVSLGAWKLAHFLMPACAGMGALRLVDIGVGEVVGAARVIARPLLHAPAADCHKYRRGLLAVIVGVMPGAAVLACLAAQGAGAGYVKLLGSGNTLLPLDLVADTRPPTVSLADKRISALLVGPGLGCSNEGNDSLAAALARNCPTVVDADALILLRPGQLASRTAPIIATPHEGELAALERAFGCTGSGSKPDRAAALAQASGMIIVAKGPDTVIAAPDGRMACAKRGSSWLSVAGTGDVLAGTIASRLATGAEVFAAACDGVWLHSEAARLCGPAFTASQLASKVPEAYAACL